MALARITTGLVSDLRTQIKNKLISDMTHVGVGTGNSTPSASQTELDAQVLRKARIEFTNLLNSVVISGYFNAADANSNTLLEGGTFSSSGGATLKSRFLINPLVKTDDKELWIDNEIKVRIVQESES